MEIGAKKDFLYLTFQLFLENTPDMIFIKDKNLVYVAASQPFAKFAGLAHAADIVGKTDDAFFSPALAKKYTDDDRAILASGVPSLDYIEPTPDKDGKKQYSSTSKYIIFGDDGQIMGLYGMARDVTAQVELEVERESSHLSRQMFDDLLEADLAEDRILNTGDSGWMQTLGAHRGNSYSAEVERMSATLVHPDHAEAFLYRYRLEPLLTAFHSGVYEFSHITYLRGNMDSYRWVECRTRIYHSRISNTVRTTIFFKDVDDVVLENQQLQLRANTDALTGLCNRASVLEQISVALSPGQAGGLCALLFVDLDCFKQVNDRWGHRFGDQVLQQIADRLREIFQGVHSFGRIGGDEFLVFLSNVASRQEVEEWASQVVTPMPIHPDAGCAEQWVTCSVGVALGRVGEVTVEQLVEWADRAMYQAKVTGRDRVCVYSDEAGERAAQEGSSTEVPK